MELRKHPKMTWQGLPSWPPRWNGPHGPDNPLPQGEVGILMRVETAADNTIAPHCVLVIHHNDQDYLGNLSFDDEEFLATVCAILNAHIGEPISTIGSLDISDD
jgi:hypothetical protein